MRRTRCASAGTATEESAITLELAIPLLEDAAGGRVEGLVGDEDPFLADSTVLETGSYDEIIVSTLPARVSHWLHIDLPTRLQRFGLPITVVTAKGGPSAGARPSRRPSLRPAGLERRPLRRCRGRCAVASREAVLRTLDRRIE